MIYLRITQPTEWHAWKMYNQDGKNIANSDSNLPTFELAEQDAMRYWRDECGNQVLKLA